MQRSDPDARLMLAFRAGDESALSELYRRWAGPLLRFLERMVTEPAIAEELMQETFIRVHGARERYAADARFSTWLFRIGRNLALNELDRSRNRAPHLSTDVAANTGNAYSSANPGNAGREAGDASPSLTLVAGGASVEDLVDARREQRRVEAALAEIPERQRTALWLVAAYGYAYADIAEVLDTSPESVKALVHRARTNLADRMAAPATGMSKAEGSQ